MGLISARECMTARYLIARHASIVALIRGRVNCGREDESCLIFSSCDARGVVHIHYINCTLDSLPMGFI